MDKRLSEQLQAMWPEVIGAVITKRQDRVNLCPINFQAVSTAYELPLTACIGLGNTSYTLEIIKETGEFVYAYPSKEQLADILRCGAISGRDEDKIAQTRLSFSESKHLGVPLLDDAVLNYECRVVHMYDAGSFTIVIGKAVAIHPSNKDKLDKIYTLGGLGYGTLTGLNTLQESRL